MRLRLALLAFAMAFPSVAMAQQPAPIAREPYRSWDIGGALAIRFGDTDDAVVAKGAWMGELGRYWTPHFRTSIAMATAGQDTYGATSYDPRTFAGSYTSTITRPAGFGASAAWQFLDNEFVHPFISGGARFATTSTTTVISAPRSPTQFITAPDRLEVRPVIGGGFKSYFDNGRVFMRTELLMSIRPDGLVHPVLQIGAGIDF
jgi:hypothetical protein